MQKRLMHWLDKAWASDSPLIIIRGSEGSGKSTLLVNWLAHTQHDVSHSIWHYPRISKITRGGFWIHLLQDFIDAKVVSSESTLAQSIFQLHATQGLELLEETLRALNTLSKPLLIIIDNYSQLSKIMDLKISEDFFWLVQRTRNLRVIILTTDSGSPEFLEQLTATGTPVLEEQELFFAEEETKDFCHSVLGPSPEIAEHIHGTLQGNIRMTSAVIRALTRKDPSQRSMHLVEQLVDEQLNNAFDTLSNFLDKKSELRPLYFLAIAENLDQELIHILSSGLEAHTALKFAAEIGIAFWHKTDAVNLFSFLPSIRIRLEEKLERDFPEEVHRLRKQYALWLLDRQKLDQVLAQLEKIGDLDLLVQIITEHFETLRTLYPELVMRIINTISYKDLRQNPVLLVVLALHKNANKNISMNQVIALLNLVISQLSHNRKNISDVQQGWVELARSGAYALSGLYKQANHHADLALTLFNRLKLEAASIRNMNLWSEPMGLLLLIKLVCDEFEQAEVIARELYDALRTRDPKIISYSLIHALSTLSFLHATRGNTKELKELLDETKTISTAVDWQKDYSSWGVCYAEASLAVDRFDIQGAREALAQMDKHYETIATWPELMTMKLWTELAANNAYLGSIRINEERSKRRNAQQGLSPISSAILESKNADLLLAAGRVDLAQKSLARIPASQLSRPEVLLCRARLHLLTSEPQLANSLLSHVIWDSKTTLRQLAEALLVQAVAEHRLGRHADAVKRFEKSLHLIQHHDLRSILMMAPHSDLREMWKSQSEFPITLLDGVPDHFSSITTAIVLTKRESEILHELNSKLSIVEIANRNFVSRNTIKAQLRSIYRKLGVNSRREAVMLAIEQNLIEYSAE
ncbi:MAG: LuxR C-terminal-related transcriptional regulator [Microbacteriaceae bacterium]